MNLFQRALLIGLITLPFITACASRSQSSYYASEVGQVMSTEQVSVQSSRLVQIEGLSDNNRPGWGAAVGATVAGASAYGVTEGDNPAGVAITVIALIGGALAGQFIDEKLKSSLGVEYILRTPEGKHIAVVQTVADKSEQIQANQPALLIRGQAGYVRVVPQ